MQKSPGTGPAPRSDASAALQSRIAYTLLGAAAGLALVVGAIVHDAVPARHAAMFVGAGPLFGAFAGFDFYATRYWRGRVALLLRLELSCLTAASLTGLCGLLVGAVGRKDVMPITLWGAGIGLYCWLYNTFGELRDRAA